MVFRKMSKSEKMHGKVWSCLWWQIIFHLKSFVKLTSGCSSRATSHLFYVLFFTFIKKNYLSYSHMNDIVKYIFTPWLVPWYTRNKKLQTTWITCMLSSRNIYIGYIQSVHSNLNTLGYKMNMKYWSKMGHTVSRKS